MLACINAPDGVVAVRDVGKVGQADVVQTFRVVRERRPNAG